MNHVILVLGATNFLLVAITAFLGLLSQPPVDANHLGDGAFLYHLPLGIFTALFTMLVNCLVMTYFLGTNRWVRETAEAYALDPRFTMRSRSCRTRSMMVIVPSILLVVATIATGAGTHTKVWPLWLHWVAPAVTYLFVFYAYFVEYFAVEEHIQLTDEVMVEVDRIRAERGQPALSAVEE
ncbi:hypothetical protein Pan216_19590 [Planctomycetes bacterium Pan216]|uniref:Uncharacterized protein n=1 Tax=Kolteria novifilia TaxID=2527975 RepID=A0A518B293_9BACT|nr:hypothetical protein Pan216_19590 [Planctomycetes bacterium Pan216]